jgi:DNA-binding LytR/AlgR family response regulator
MTSAVIADDEPHLAEYLRASLARLWPELYVWPAAAHGVQALELIERHQPEVAFLDIKMPGMDGLEVAARLAHQACRVVFVTAYDQFAIEAFEHHAVDYLLKPVSDERLMRCVDHLREALVQREQAPRLDALLQQITASLGAAPARASPLRWIRAGVGDTVRQIAVEEVLCFKAADKYTIVQLRDGESEGEILIRVSLSELLLQLDPERFWQVHRGTVVNVERVESARRDVLGKTLLKLRGHAQDIVVSRQYAHLFRQM